MDNGLEYVLEIQLADGLNKLDLNRYPWDYQNTSAGSDLHKDTVNSIIEVVSWP